MTLSRVKNVIDDALEAEDYGSGFDADVAADAVECYLSHNACWDEQVDMFQEQIDKGYGPDGDEDLDALECIQTLSETVTAILNRNASFEYGEGIDRGALLELILKTHPALMQKIGGDVTEDDFINLWTDILCSCIVGGLSFAEDEFSNCANIVGADKETIISILEADEKGEHGC